MSWASRRKWIIIFLIAAVIIALIAVTLIATLYKAPSCADHTQNQGEKGIDCGGPCSTLCSADEIGLSAEFVRQLSPAPGRTDVIAYIDNKNADAAAAKAPFTITLYGPDNIVVAEKSGAFDIPAKSRLPLFVPNFYSGYQPVARAFISFATTTWQRESEAPLILPVSNVVLSGTDAPRITADVSNPTALPLLNIAVVATVFDADNNAIAASQTVLQKIPPMSSSPAVFTWNVPFSAAPAREEVIPLAPLR